MALPWTTVDRVDTVHGELELRQRGKTDFLILIDGRVLMNASERRSELALGELTGRSVANKSQPRVLIGGLGMAITLRATLDALPESAQVLVVEIEPAVDAWCRGPLAPLTDSAVCDPRVSLQLGDVADVIEGADHKFDCIALDLFEGPAERAAKSDRLYGPRGLAAARRALAPGGVYAVWSEKPGSAFEKRLSRAGFIFECKRPGKGGLRHAVYLARVRPVRRGSVARNL